MNLLPVKESGYLSKHSLTSCYTTLTSPTASFFSIHELDADLESLSRSSLVPRLGSGTALEEPVLRKPALQVEGSGTRNLTWFVSLILRWCLLVVAKDDVESVVVVRGVVTLCGLIHRDNTQKIQVRYWRSHKCRTRCIENEYIESNSTDKKYTQNGAEFILSDIFRARRFKRKNIIYLLVRRKFLL